MAPDAEKPGRHVKGWDSAVAKLSLASDIAATFCSFP